jgi:glutamate--cysteine ligase catalytic subunit
MAKSERKGTRCIVVGRRSGWLEQDHPSSNEYQIEYLVVAIDEQQKKVRLSLCQADVLKSLAKDEQLAKNTMVQDG